MAAPISPIQPVPVALPAVTPPGQGQSGGAVFQSVLNEAVSRIDTLNQNAQDSVMKFLSGEGGEIHRVALAVHESQSAFEMFLQVRNKVISAYQEVMRMQL
jgi:flagellar hook-basal body complex protein FliE